MSLKLNNFCNVPQLVADVAFVLLHVALQLLVDSDTIMYCKQHGSHSITRIWYQGQNQNNGSYHQGKSHIS